MKDRNLLDRLGDFVLGKGFYIVLFLCVATIGISGYYLVRTMHNPAAPSEELEAAGGNTPVVLPDSEANGPDPAGTFPIQRPEEAEPSGSPAQAAPEQPDDPESMRQASAQVEDVPATQEPEGEEELPSSFTWPVKGELLRDFSLDTLSLDPTMGDWRTHGGVDVASSLGSQVLAMAAGTVSRVYDDGLMGATVMIEHGGELTSLCCGLAGQPPVEEGDRVEAGGIIGSVGSTAIAESSQPVHVHIETWLDGTPVNPLDYLPQP